MTLRASIATLTLIASGLGLVAGCNSSNSLGAPCTMVKSANTDGGDPFASTELLWGDLMPDNDYVSRGALDCTDLEQTCEFDKKMYEDQVAKGRPADSTVVHGICTRRCDTEGPTTECNRDPEMVAQDPIKDPTLVCRSLALDPETVTTICRQDAGACQKYFGGNPYALYCAHELPAPGDAGTP